MPATSFTRALGVSFLALALVQGWTLRAAPDVETAGGAQAGTAAASVSVPGGAVGPASFAHIARRVMPGVVTLTTAQWLGSGFVIDREGLVVTNAHVVTGQKDIKVHFPDGTHFPAKLIGADIATDIALLKIDGKKSFPSLPLGNDRKLSVGDWVLAIGSPDGLTGTVTAGIVSAIHRDGFRGARVFTDYIQIDAAINHGNSGGPTFDMQGQVVGMNALGSYISTNCSGAVCERNDGIGFTIPVSTIRRVVDDLKSGPVQRSIVGILVEPVTEEVQLALGLLTTRGALVSDVVKDSPADKAGIRAGDVVLKVNGHDVVDDRDCLRQTAMIDAGKPAKFTLFRDGKTLNLTATVVNRTDVIDLGPDTVSGTEGERAVKPLGLELQSSDGAGQPGLGITGIVAGSDADQRGLRIGDRILKIGGREVTTLSDVNLAVEQARALKRNHIMMQVVNSMGVRALVVIKIPD
jgi:serine protease Do